MAKRNKEDGHQFFGWGRGIIWVAPRWSTTKETSLNVLDSESNLYLSLEELEFSSAPGKLSGRLSLATQRSGRLKALLSG
jgi:hypothetical protein